MTRRTILMLLTATALTANASAMTISSDAQGNTVPAGKVLTFTIKDAKGPVNFDVVDYYDQKIASGTGTTIELSGLKPGWYKLTCKDKAGEAFTTAGVLLDRGNAALPTDGRIAADTIGSGFAHAKLVRLAGIPWVRERLWWGVVQYSAGPVDWKEYPKGAEQLAAEGIHVTQIWHDSPPWLHPKNPNTAVPDDLRDIYRFSRETAAKFAGKWHSLEMGNEPDGGWMGDRFAGYEKAASLGLRDGNPAVIVSPASIGFGITPFLKQIYESGLADYCDIFNWHFYGKPDQIAWNLNGYLSLLKEHHADTRPVWITEGGVPMPAEAGPNKRDLTMASQRVIAPATVKNAAMALAMGNDRYFVFSFSCHFERGLEFGLFYPDMKPYPQFVVYSTAANFLGEADYLGEFKVGPGVTVQAFSTPTGTLLAGWADKDTPVVIPSERTTVRQANIFGAETTLKAENGTIRVTVGPEPIYLVDAGQVVRAKLTGTVRPRGKLPTRNPSRVVLMGYCDRPANMELSRYEFENPKSPEPFMFTVEVYNFEAKEKRAGTVELAIPAGWSVDKPAQPAAVEPMGRTILTFKVTPAAPRTVEELNARIRVSGRFGADKVSPSISAFGFDPAVLPVVERKPLAWTEAGAWRTETSGSGNDNAVMVPMTVTAGGKNTLRVQGEEKKITAGSDDKFSYAILKFPSPVDLSDYDGIALNAGAGSNGGMVRLMLLEPNGAHYFHTLSCPPNEKKRFVLPFQNMRWAMWFTGDPNCRMDLNQIAAVKLGREGDNVSFEAGDFELVKLPSTLRK